MVLALILSALGAWRFFGVRSKGTSVILRRLPAQGLHGWRHGIFQYDGTELRYFKLRSLKAGADTTFNRKAVTLQGHRDANSREVPILLGSKDILLFSCNDVEYEVVFQGRAEMAFVSWLESAPDERFERIDLQSLRRKFSTH